MDDYGVFTTYIKPEGVYAYGIMIIKDPNYEHPIAYIMAGAQNQWFHYTNITDNRLYLRIFIDFNSSKILVIDEDCKTKEYKINDKPMIKQLYIASFNVTGKTHPQPDISINKLRLYVSNHTINELINNICAPKLGLGKPVLDISHTQTETTTTTTSQTSTETTTTTQKTTTTTSIQQTIPNEFFLAILVIGVILIGVLLLTRKKRSPGP